MGQGINATSLSVAVRETLSQIPNDPQDAALRALIVKYADEIDTTGTTEKLGSRLLSALDALMATPRARARQGDPDALTTDRLSEFFGGPGE